MTTVPELTDSGLDPRSRRSWSLPLNNPPVVATGAATGMLADDLVVGVAHAGRLRAYPWWIVANFHVVNDTFIDRAEAGTARWRGSNLEPRRPGSSGGAVLVTLCEACSTAGAFVPDTVDGSERGLVFSCCFPGPDEPFRSFGTYTICDLKTLSRWHPHSGSAVSGTLAGCRLHRLPLLIDRWDDWRRDFPDSDVVVASPEMRQRPHVHDLPALDDGASVHSSLAAALGAGATIDRRLDPGQLVLGIELDDRSLAIPATVVDRAGGVIAFDAGSRPALVVRHGVRMAAFARADGDDGSSWSIDRQRVELVAGQGRAYDLFGRSVPSGGGRADLEVLQGSYPSKWSAWSSFHPRTEILGATS